MNVIKSVNLDANLTPSVVYIGQAYRSASNVYVVEVNFANDVDLSYSVMLNGSRRTLANKSIDVTPYGLLMNRVTNRKFTYELTNWFTEYTGKLVMSVAIYSPNENDSQLIARSGTFYLAINDSIQSSLENEPELPVAFATKVDKVISAYPTYDGSGYVYVDQEGTPAKMDATTIALNSEVDEKLALKLDKTGGTISGYLSTYTLGVTSLASIANLSATTVNATNVNAANVGTSSTPITSLYAQYVQIKGSLYGDAYEKLTAECSLIPESSDTYDLGESIKSWNNIYAVNGKFATSLKVNDKEVGTTLTASINQTDYKLTIQLKDANDVVLSSQVVDLPLETMIVSATYDSATKDLIFTLQNGTTLTVPLDDIISGLVPDTRKVNNKPLTADVTLNKSDIGLANVDNTSDSNKPISVATQTALDTKANKNGSYDQMTVGLAKQLLSPDGVIDNAEFMTRTTAGSTSVTDGNVVINKVKGLTLVKNQILNPAKYGPNKNENNVVITKNTTTEEITVVVGTGGATGLGQFEVTSNSNTPVIAGHKYLLRGCPSGGGTSTYMIDTGFSIGTDKGNGTIGTASASKYVRILVWSGCPEGTYVFKPQLIDLTIMFGAGNEPTTVAEFYSRFGSGYIPYNEGELISSKPTSLNATGKNLYNPNAEYQLVAGGNTYKYLQDVTISNYTLNEYDNEYNLINTSTVTYGATFTVLANTNYIKLEGLGTPTEQYLWLPWSDWTNLTMDDYAPYVEHTQLIDTTPFPDGMRSAGSVCDEKDYVIRKNYLRVGSRAYQSGDESDATLTTDGITTNYPLATPVVTDIPITENNTLEVCDHGLEWETNASGYIAPFHADLFYMENLRDNLRTTYRKFNSFIAAFQTYNNVTVSWSSDNDTCTITSNGG